MKLTNKLGLPEAIVNAVKAYSDDYDAGDSDATVTELIGPPQLGALLRQHYDELSEDASDRVYALMGQAMHDILQRSEHSALTENRLFTEVHGWKVSGAYDRLSLVSGGTFAGLIQDYKVASVWEYRLGVKPERTHQLNLLAELARRNGYNIAGLEIVYIFRDWSKNEARRNHEYPQTQVYRYPLKLWTSEYASRYLDSRVLAHQHARDALKRGDPLPECTDDERWAKGTTWAVIKPGTKRAQRVFNNRKEADELAATIKGGMVQMRQGESTRCIGYCPVRDVCPQFKRMETGGEE